MSEVTKTSNTPGSDSEVSVTSSDGSSLQIDESPGYVTAASTMSASSSSASATQQDRHARPATFQEDWAERQSTSQQARAEIPSTYRQDLAERLSTAQQVRAEWSATAQKDRRESPSKTQNYRGESPLKTQKDLGQSPSKTQKDRGQSPSKTQKDRNESPSKSQKDRVEAPAETRDDQGRSSSKAIWRCVSSVCCCRSNCFPASQENAGETHAIEMQVQDFREDERSAATSGHHGERSQSSSEPESTSQSSASGYTSRPNMFPNMSRSQQELYERLRDPEHEMIEAREYRERMGFLPIEQIKRPWQPMEILDRDTLMEMWRPPPNVRTMEENARETRVNKMQARDFREEERSAATSEHHGERSQSSSEPESSTPGSTSQSSASGYTSQPNMFPDMSRSQQELYERLRDPENEMNEAREYRERMGFLPIEQIKRPWQPMEVLHRESLSEMCRASPNVGPLEMSVEERRRRDRYEMAMRAQPREYEATRRQYTGDDDESEYDDTEGTSSEFSSETARSQELAELMRRQQMVEVEDDSEDKETERCSDK